MVDECVNRGMFDTAISSLNSARSRGVFSPDNDKEYAAQAMKMVEPSLNKKEYKIAEWAMQRACEVYEVGSPEHRQVVDKGMKILDECIVAGEVGFAHDIVRRALETYPAGSPEYEKAAQQQVVIREKMSVAHQLGSKDQSFVKVVAIPIKDRKKAHVVAGP